MEMFSMMEEGSGAAAKFGSALASLMFLWAVISQYFPHQFDLYFAAYFHKAVNLVYPYIQIKFPEHVGEKLKRSEAYTYIEAYLASTCTASAKKLRAELGRESKKVDLSMDDYEEVTDVFRGAKVWWSSGSVKSKAPSMSWKARPDDRRFYCLTFHSRYKELIEGAYLDHVMVEGKAAGVRKRQRRLFTNNPTTGYFEFKKQLWSDVPLEHPATFDTVALEPEMKRDIVQDLLTFSRSKDYYAKIGKAWKRGYLLHGPPGTGKSTMIAAMANFLDYDVYDLELTAVRDNTFLRKLLIDTTGKSIIVIEDIDCSLDLTGKRRKKKKKEEEELPPWEREEASKVTLSGLLNFIDGLWSACGSERLIVFTTNHIEKLDPALIRRGRMDKHIELSHCGFEAFKVLAKNYLDIDEHRLFRKVRELMAEVKITPADVAEILMPKEKIGTSEAADICLKNLVRAMEDIKTKPAAVPAAEIVSEEDDSEDSDNGGVDDDDDDDDTEGGDDDMSSEKEE